MQETAYLTCRQIDSLLEQSRKAVEDAAKAKDSSTENKAFSYAKVWEKNGGLHELAEEEETGANAEEQRGFWGAVCKLSFKKDILSHCSGFRLTLTMQLQWHSRYAMLFTLKKSSR